MLDLPYSLRIPIILFIVLLLAETGFGQKQTFNGTAVQLLEQTIASMGKGWDTVKTLKLEGYGHEDVIDQSERFEGPYIPIGLTKNIVIDIPDKKERVERSQTSSISSFTATWLLNENSMAVKRGSQVKEAYPDDALQDQMILGPEFLLRHASDAKTSLEYQKDTMLQKTNQHVLRFLFHQFPVRIFINAETYMLTASELTKPYESGYGRIWGDSKITVLYSYWVLLGNNIHYPAQTDTYLNQYKVQSFLFTKWVVNPPLSADSLAIPDSIQQKSVQMYKKIEDMYVDRMHTGVKEISKDVWVLPGPCNTTVVKQNDGLVVIESPFSSAYGEAVYNKIRELYPKEKVKAFIATSDAWLHLGGIREFATMNIQVYFPYRNETLIKNILNAPYQTEPDRLAKAGKIQCRLKGVHDTLVIGTGENRIVLYPYRTETGDRMMMVYFPQTRILYGSDLYQPPKKDGTWWFPHYSWEVYSAIKSYHIPAEKIYAMHQAQPVDCSVLEKDFGL